MTTIVLVHASEYCPRFQVFAVYEAPDVHHAFGLEETSTRDEAEHVARQMMETFEADHFRRVMGAIPYCVASFPRFLGMHDRW